MTIENRTIFEGDNLPILRSMQTTSVDLIYLDPPFNSNRNYEASIGSEAAGAAFKDSWTLDDVKDEWHKDISNYNVSLYRAIECAEQTHSVSMKAYLIMMSVRLIEMQRILKVTGSIYLHCDPTASHYLKTVTDSIFGNNCFRNEIVWKRAAAGKGAKGKQWPRIHDSILLYSNSDNFCFNHAYKELSKDQSNRYIHREIDTCRMYQTVMIGDYSQESIQKMLHEGLIHTSKSGKRYKKYYLDEAKATIGSIWTDIPGFGIRTNAKERVGYPTQKPIALLDRIIKASSNQGDLILDPFCGCATTCVAAERLSRRWIGIDISPKAVELVKTRIEKELGIFGEIHHVKYSDIKGD